MPGEITRLLFQFDTFHGEAAARAVLYDTGDMLEVTVDIAQPFEQGQLVSLTFEVFPGSPDGGELGKLADWLSSQVVALVADWQYRTRVGGTWNPDMEAT